MGEVILMTDAITGLGALEFKKFGEYFSHQPRLLKELQPDRWARGEEDLIELGGYSFGRDDLDTLSIAPDSGEGVGVDKEAQLRSEAYRPHHT